MAIIKSNLSEMKLGWFVGNFEPSLYKTNDVEVAIKSYHVVERNSNKFNDEKVMKKMAKYE